VLVVGAAVTAPFWAGPTAVALGVITIAGAASYALAASDSLSCTPGNAPAKPKSNAPVRTKGPAIATGPTGTAEQADPDEAQPAPAPGEAPAADTQTGGLNTQLDDACFSGALQRADGTRTAGVWECGGSVPGHSETCTCDGGRINPGDVRFSQDSVGANFKNGSSVNDTAAALRNGDISANDFPTIRLVERDGHMFTLDNRRLVAFQKAGIPDVPYVMASPEEVAAEAWKFTTKDSGASILVRGINETWSPNG
jgi:hypothetical protein